jgi:hypothetical protein
LQAIRLDLDFTGAGRSCTSRQHETQKKRQPQQFTRFGQNITSIDRRSNFYYTQDRTKKRAARRNTPAAQYTAAQINPTWLARSASQSNPSDPVSF